MKQLLIGLSTLLSVSSYAGHLTAQIKVNGAGELPSFVRINSTLLEPKDFKCTNKVKPGFFDCSASIDFIAILNDATLSVIGNYGTVELEISSIKLGNECELLSGPLSYRRDVKVIRVYESLDLGTCH